MKYYYIVTIIDGYADEAMVDVYGDPEFNRTLLFKTHEEATKKLEEAAKDAVNSCSCTMYNGKLEVGKVFTSKMRDKDNHWAGDVQAYVAEAMVVE